MQRQGAKVGVNENVFCSAHVLTSYFAVFHICAGESELSVFSFLCPNGTLFNQQYFVCDWWFNVDCDNSAQFYSLNDELDNARQASPLTSDVPKVETSYKVNKTFLKSFPDFSVKTE